MKQGNFVMVDAGCGITQKFIYAQEQNTDVIFRITPKKLCLHDAQ